MKTDETGKIVYLTAEIEIPKERGEAVRAYLHKHSIGHLVHGLIHPNSEGEPVYYVHALTIHQNTKIIFI